jgi:hypothetical protein
MAEPYRTVTSPSGETYYQVYDPAFGVWRSAGSTTPQANNQTVYTPGPTYEQKRDVLSQAPSKEVPLSYEGTREPVSQTVSPQAKEYIFTHFAIGEVTPGQPGYSSYKNMADELEKNNPAWSEMRKRKQTESQQSIEYDAFVSQATPISSKFGVPVSDVSSLLTTEGGGVIGFTSKEGKMYRDIPKGYEGMSTREGEVLISKTVPSDLSTGMSKWEPPPPKPYAGIQDWVKAQPILTPEVMVLATSAASTGQPLSKEGMELYAQQQRTLAFNEEVMRKTIDVNIGGKGFGIGLGSGLSQTFKVDVKNAGVLAPVFSESAVMGNVILGSLGTGFVDVPVQIGRNLLNPKPDVRNLEPGFKALGTGAILTGGAMLGSAVGTFQGKPGAFGETAANVVMLGGGFVAGKGIGPLSRELVSPKTRALIQAGKNQMGYEVVKFASEQEALIKPPTQPEFGLRANLPKITSDLRVTRPVMMGVPEDVVFVKNLNVGGPDFLASGKTIVRASPKDFTLNPARETTPGTYLKPSPGPLSVEGGVSVTGKAGVEVLRTPKYQEFAQYIEGKITAKGVSVSISKEPAIGTTADATLTNFGGRYVSLKTSEGVTIKETGNIYSDYMDLRGQPLQRFLQGGRENIGKQIVPSEIRYLTRSPKGEMVTGEFVFNLERTGATEIAAGPGTPSDNVFFSTRPSGEFITEKPLPGVKAKQPKGSYYRVPSLDDILAFDIYQGLKSRITGKPSKGGVSIETGRGKPEVMQDFGVSLELSKGEKAVIRGYREQRITELEAKGREAYPETGFFSRQKLVSDTERLINLPKGTPIKTKLGVKLGIEPTVTEEVTPSVGEFMSGFAQGEAGKAGVGYPIPPIPQGTSRTKLGSGSLGKTGRMEVFGERIRPYGSDSKVVPPRLIYVNRGDERGKELTYEKSQNRARELSGERTNQFDIGKTVSKTLSDLSTETLTKGKTNILERTNILTDTQIIVPTRIITPTKPHETPPPPPPIIKTPWSGGGFSGRPFGGGMPSPRRKAGRFRRKTGIQPLLTYREKTNLELGLHKPVSAILPRTKANVATYVKNQFGYTGKSGFVEGMKIVFPGGKRKRK